MVVLGGAAVCYERGTPVAWFCSTSRNWLVIGPSGGACPFSRVIPLVFRGLDLGFRVQSSVFSDEVLRFRFRVRGLGLRVEGRG